MSKVWHPKTQEEAFKRKAGRKKLHQRKRKERADRIVRLLATLEAAPERQRDLSVRRETRRRECSTHTSNVNARANNVNTTSADRG